MSTLEETVDEVVNGKKKVSYADLLRDPGFERPPEREPEPDTSQYFEALKTQRQKALEQQRWARKHPQEYRKLMSLRGKPVAQQEYLESLSRKEQKIFEQKQTVAREEWRQQLRQQYPVGEYLILWRDKDRAEIYGGYPKPTPRKARFTGGLKVGRLERGALSFWSDLSAEEPETVWRSPFKPVSKRYGGLAETDIPRDVEEIASSLFSWHEEHLTPLEFEEKYGPFESPLDLPKGTRITHVRKTGRGFEMKYLPPHSLDVTKPWGITKTDVEAWEKQGRIFTAHLAKSFMAGGIWQKAELTPKQFREKHGVSFELPEDSLITSWRFGAKGYEIKYMPREEWEALPQYVKEGKQPGFWEVPFFSHLVKGWGVLLKEGEKRREQLFGKQYVAMEKLGPRGAWRESEKRIGYGTIGFVKGGESFVGFLESMTGHPSHRTYIPTFSGAVTQTALSFFPETRIGPVTIGKGGWGATGEYWEAEWESVKEHPEMIAGELAFDIFLAYLTGKAIGKVGGRVGKTRIGTRISTTRVAKAFRRLTTKPRVERLSEIGELQVQQIKPYEYTLQRMSQMKTVFSKISWREADFIEDLLKHTSIQQLEVGGVQIGKISTPKIAILGKTPSLFLRPAEPFLTALKAGEKTVLGLYKVGPVVKSPITATAVRHYTATAWWGIIEEGYLRKLLQHAMATKFLGGVVTKTVSQKTLWKIPSFIGLSTTPTISRVATQTLMGFGAVATAKSLQPRVPERLAFPSTTKRARLERMSLSIPRVQERQRRVPRLTPTETPIGITSPKIERDFPIIRPVQADLPMQVPRSMTGPILSATTRLRQMQAPQLQVLQADVPVPVPTVPRIIPFRRPLGGEDFSKRAKDLRGLWFKKTHPIKSHQAMWETFHGSKKPRKRQKAKSKRRQKRKRGRKQKRR